MNHEIKALCVTKQFGRAIDFAAKLPSSESAVCLVAIGDRICKNINRGRDRDHLLSNLIFAMAGKRDFASALTYVDHLSDSVLSAQMKSGLMTTLADLHSRAA